MGLYRHEQTMTIIVRMRPGYQRTFDFLHGVTNSCQLLEFCGRLAVTVWSFGSGRTPSLIRLPWWTYAMHLLCFYEVKLHAWLFFLWHTGQCLKHRRSCYPWNIHFPHWVGGKGRAEKFLSMIDHLDLSHNFFFFFTVKSVQNNDNVNKLNT